MLVKSGKMAEFDGSIVSYRAFLGKLDNQVISICEKMKEFNYIKTIYLEFKRSLEEYEENNIKIGIDDEIRTEGSIIKTISIQNSAKFVRLLNKKFHSKFK